MSLFLALLLLGLGWAAGAGVATMVGWRHQDREQKIIEVLADHEGQLAGPEIGVRAEVPTGAVYRVLGRLVRLGMVRSEFKDYGVFRRRYYQWLGDDPQ